MKSNFMQVFVASMLRDMRTRFGRTYVSFIISIAWPLLHISVICGIYYFSTRLAPIGDDPGIFVTTGVAPYIFCLYPARFTASAIIQNKPLLLFPVVTPLHLIMVRCAIELLSASLVFVIFFLALYIIGIAVIPIDFYAATLAIAATVYLGLCIGIFGVMLSALSPIVGMLTVVFFIVGLYLSSGALVPTSIFSSRYHEIVEYNPLYQSIGLLRSAYFTGFDASDYSMFYVFMVGSLFLALGLGAERILRGKIYA
jgi:capsular polysaccharide transport system permease protein